MLDPECRECGAFCRRTKVKGLVKCENCGLMQAGVIPGPESDPAFAMDLVAKHTGVKAPDYADVMVGWRAWQIECEVDEDEDLGLLWSVTHPEHGPWTPREPMVAVCTKNPNEWHEPPAEGCTCGLYAAKDRSHLQSMSYHRYDTHKSSVNGGEVWCAIGTVSLYGGVIPGSQGWKAGKAYPREILLPYEAYRVAKPITEKYGVPVRLHNVLRTPNIIQH
jgi:hypothetical protein